MKIFRRNFAWTFIPRNRIQKQNRIRKAPTNPKGSLTDRKLALRNQRKIEETIEVNIEKKISMRK